MATQHRGEIISLRNIRKSVEGLEILRGIDLAVGSGEIIVIRGRSGVGKTTLARILALIDLPDSGSVTFMGIDVSSVNDHVRSWLRIKYIGYIDQFFQLFSNMTIYENIEFVLRILGIPRSNRSEMILEILKRLGIFDKRDKYPNQLSGGERQRVAIARAIIKKPVLVVGDEPFSNLDEETSKIIFELFKELINQGSSVVITTTDLYAEFPSTVSREYLLDKGFLRVLR
ncbi:MAG: ABC transporter ATP-binding protein [Sulfolobales archaeon]